jgi:hypothetical protein
MTITFNESPREFNAERIFNREAAAAAAAAAAARQLLVRFVFRAMAVRRIMTGASRKGVESLENDLTVIGYLSSTIKIPVSAETSDTELLES